MAPATATRALTTFSRGMTVKPITRVRSAATLSAIPLAIHSSAGSRVTFSKSSTASVSGRATATASPEATFCSSARKARAEGYRRPASLASACASTGQRPAGTPDPRSGSGSRDRTATIRSAAVAPPKAGRPLTAS